MVLTTSALCFRPGMSVPGEVVNTFCCLPCSWLDCFQFSESRKIQRGALTCICLKKCRLMRCTQSFISRKKSTKLIEELNWVYFPLRLFTLKSHRVWYLHQLQSQTCSVYSSELKSLRKLGLPPVLTGSACCQVSGEAVAGSELGHSSACHTITSTCFAPEWTGESWAARKRHAVVSRGGCLFSARIGAMRGWERSAVIKGEGMTHQCSLHLNKSGQIGSDNYL